MTEPTDTPLRIDRRGFMRRMAVLSVGASAVGSSLLAACTSSTATQTAPTSPPAAAPKPTTAAAAPAAQATQPAQAAAATKSGLSGTIAVSYPDELGKKPAYVTA